MYYPILRGKLNELLALRELSDLTINKNFIPIIEPVRDNLLPLVKTINALNDCGIKPIIIVNPENGDFSKNYVPLLSELSNQNNIDYLPCIVINDNLKIFNEIKAQIGSFGLFIAGGISPEIIEASHEAKFNIINHNVSPHVLARFNNVILYEDFFKRQKRNADYSAESSFSSLHAYYKNSGNVIGFGDYTIVGEDFSESGGPAYVVTIHASYIDSSRFDEMFIRHYCSYDDKTPTNPGSKFKDALRQLIEDVDLGRVSFTKTNALDEFRKIYKNEHFPGLGQVKKISMKHHIETLNNYLNKVR